MRKAILALMQLIYVGEDRPLTPEEETDLIVGFCILAIVFGCVFVFGLL